MVAPLRGQAPPGDAYGSLIVGLDDGDDAAVVADPRGGPAFVGTTDFFTPVVDAETNQAEKQNERAASASSADEPAKSAQHEPAKDAPAKLELVPSEDDAPATSTGDAPVPTSGDADPKPADPKPSDPRPADPKPDE